jgi:uncharacterized protein (TIGR02147 family)
MIEHHISYRKFLKAVLEKKTSQNPRYSLRAMAAQLDLSPALLSTVMSGKKNISPERAHKVTKALKLNKKETDLFHLLLQIETTADEDLKLILLEKLKRAGGSDQASELGLEHFRIVSDWYHFAILALTDLENFQLSDDQVPAVARALAISKVEVEGALVRLVNLEMLELKNGVYKKTKTNPRVQSVNPNKALRNYHRQLLEKAIQSLETQTPQEKYVGSETLAIGTDQLESFSKLTEEYFSQVLNLARNSKNKNQVYHLGIQFFRLTQKEIL